MELFNTLDVYPKIIVAMTGLIAGFIKIRDSYSAVRRKQEIKLDLEIYELMNKGYDFEKSELKKSIENKISKAYENEEETLTNFFVGLAVFVGFGLWSIDIFHKNDTFNGWIILTIICSLTGLSMLFGKNDKKKSKELFFQIGFYDKTNFQFGIFIVSLTGILTPILYYKNGGFSFWLYLTGLFCIIGLIGMYRNVRRIK